MHTLLKCIATLLLITGIFHASEKEAKRPNVIFIFPDQLRNCSLGFMNEEPVQTPNLDKFAKESVVFTQAISNFPVCSPYRAIMLSGLYPNKTGIKTNMNSRSHPLELSVDTICWSDVLAQNGYDLAYFGKYHLDTPHEPYIKTPNNEGKVKWNEWTPPARRHGFKHWVAYGTYDAHLKPMYWQTNDQRDDWKFVNEWGPTYEVNRAIEYLENKNGELRDNEKPFGMVISMNPPHSGYNHVPQKYRDIYKDFTDEQVLVRKNIPPAGTPMGDSYRKNIRDYYACITGVDYEFGRLLAYLEEKGLAENTLIIFSSDHGDCLGANNVLTKNELYEEAVNVPFIVRYPAQIKNAFKTDYLTSVPDIFPTIMEFTGNKNNAPKNLDGDSLVELLTTGKPVTTPDAQLIKRYAVCGATLLVGARDQRYTYAEQFDKAGQLHKFLFDRESDKFQLNNLAGKTEHAELEKTMHTKMKNLQTKYNEESAE